MALYHVRWLVYGPVYLQGRSSGAYQRPSPVRLDSWAGEVPQPFAGGGRARSCDLGQFSDLGGGGQSPSWGCPAEESPVRVHLCPLIPKSSNCQTTKQTTCRIRETAIHSGKRQYTFEHRLLLFRGPVKWPPMFLFLGPLYWGTTLYIHIHMHSHTHTYVGR